MPYRPLITIERWQMSAPLPSPQRPSPPHRQRGLLLVALVVILSRDGCNTQIDQIIWGDGNVWQEVTNR